MDQSFGAVVYRIHNKHLQFLLVQHSSTYFWDIPKGHPMDKEKPKETAIREVFEETNYQIKLIHNFSQSIQYSLPRGEEKKVEYFWSGWRGKIIPGNKNNSQKYGKPGGQGYGKRSVWP